MQQPKTHPKMEHLRLITNCCSVTMKKSQDLHNLSLQMENFQDYKIYSKYFQGQERLNSHTIQSVFIYFEIICQTLQKESGQTPISYNFGEVLSAQSSYIKIQRQGVIEISSEYYIANKKLFFNQKFKLDFMGNIRQQKILGKKILVLQNKIRHIQIQNRQYQRQTAASREQMQNRQLQLQNKIVCLTKKISDSQKYLQKERKEFDKKISILQKHVLKDESKKSKLIKKQNKNGSDVKKRRRRNTSRILIRKPRKRNMKKDSQKNKQMGSLKEKMNELSQIKKNIKKYHPKDESGMDQIVTFFQKNPHKVNQSHCNPKFKSSFPNISGMKLYVGKLIHKSNILERQILDLKGDKNKDGQSIHIIQKQKIEEHINKGHQIRLEQGSKANIEEKQKKEGDLRREQQNNSPSLSD